MAIALVHSTASGNIGPPPNPSTITIPSTAAGNALVVAFAGASITNPISSISAAGCTWVKGIESNTNRAASIWYALNVPAGVTSLSISFTGSPAQFVSWEVWEFSGVATTSAVSGTAAASGNSTTPTTGTITPTASRGAVVIAASRIGGAYSAGPTNGFTGVTPDGGSRTYVAYNIVASTTGSYSTGWTAGSGAWDAVILALLAPSASNASPTATLTSPGAGSFAQGASVTFTGSGSDPEDGTLTGASLTWTSSIDGAIGTGTTFSKSNLSVGTHTITLTAKDSQNATGTATVVITITGSANGTFVVRSYTYLGVTYNYKVFVPAVTAPSGGFPIITQFGGTGEFGSDNTSQVATGLGPVINSKLSTWKYLTLFPQFPAGTGNAAGQLRSDLSLNMVPAIIAAAAAEFGGNTGKSTLTGLSVGGTMGWALCAKLPSQFTAFIPTPGVMAVSSFTNLGFTASSTANCAAICAQQLSILPIWQFQGGLDTTYTPAQGHEIRDAMLTADANYKYTEYPSADHTTTWNTTYADPAVYTWIDAQVSRVDPPLAFDTTRNASDFAGRDVPVANSAAFQTALDNAIDGDKILLTPGVTYAGQFTLRKRGTPGWVEIRTNISIATLDATCPQNTRMTPAMVASLNLATIQNTASNGGIKTDVGCRGYRFTAVQFTSTVDVAGIIRFGENYVTSADICSFLGLDRCYSPGSTTLSIRRLVNGACSYGFVKDSYIRHMVDSGTDSQGIAIFGCKGPWLVQNNYCEGYAEHCIVGGAWSGLPGTNPDGYPSDVIIRGNFFTKDLSLRGTGPYIIAKNGVESKTCNRLLIENNIVEHTFRDQQVGYGILVKTDTSQDSSRIYGGSRNVEVRNNWVRNVACGFQFAANPDGTANTIHVNKVWVHDNLFENINLSPDATGDGLSVAFDGDLKDIWMEHNTFVKGTEGGNIGVRLGTPGTVATGNMFVRSNLFFNNTYGPKQDSGPRGAQAWTDYFAGTSASAFVNNVFIGSLVNDYAALPNNFKALSDSAVGFTDLAGGIYSLAPASPYKGQAHDGLDIGISNWSAFSNNLNGVSTGSFTPPPADVATSIAYVVQPSGGVNDVALPTQPQLMVLNQFGALMTSFNGTLTLTGVGATVSLGGTVTIAGGTGTASGLTLTAPNTTAFTIVASRAGLNSATSTSQTLTVQTSVPSNTIPKSLPSRTSAKAGKTLLVLWFL
jgi:dienelactone hydrolase